MDKFEIRRLNLRALVRTHCGGRAATVADKIERSASYVSRMLYPEGKPGKKRMGEDIRDLIEDAFGLPRLSLDNEEAAKAESRGLAPQEDDKSGDGSDAAQEPERRVASKVLVDVSTPVETTLERLDAQEKHLIEQYRRSTKDGKIFILSSANASPKESESELFGRSK